MRKFVIGALAIFGISAISFSFVEKDRQRLEERVAELTKENRRLERGIHLIWTEDDEALPPDGKLVRILMTVEDSVFIGLPNYSSFKGDDYRKVMYTLSNRPYAD